LTSIRKYNTNDFWELSQIEAGVPYETALYVPKIVALAFVSRNRAVFGCDGVAIDAAETFDVVQVGPSVGLDAVAAAAGTSSATLAELNPHLLGSATPPVDATNGSGGFGVRVPSGTKDATQEKLPKTKLVETERHVIRWGESLEAIAASRGTTESKLRSLNALTDPVPPRPGTTILVPTGSAGAKSAASEQPVAVVPSRVESYPGKRRVLYEVVWGDQLVDVARVLGVTVDDLCQWNNVDRTAKLHGKMVLQAFVKNGSDLAGVRTIDPKDAKVLVVGSTEFFDFFEAKNGRVRVVVTASDGDTFSSLAKKHGISIGMMERINHRSRTSKLSAGERVIVYTKRGQPTPAVKPTTPVPGEEDIYANSIGDLGG
jgi:membrane-bound lytic murein transglycosylase D